MKNIFKNMLVAGVLLASVGFSSVALADDAQAQVDATSASAVTAPAPAATATPAPFVAPAAASDAATASAPAAAADASAASAPAAVANKGDTAWMLVSTLLVILMTIPGLALFYGGLVRSKNMLSILMQVFMIFAVIIVLWCLYGYSLAFTEGNSFIGGFDRVFLKGIWDPVKGTFA